MDRAGEAARRPVSVHLKIDTGMGRLGVWHEEAPALVRKISDVEAPQACRGIHAFREPG